MSSPGLTASCLVISDTSWEGYTESPARVIEGYSTILNEVDDALDAGPAGPASRELGPHPAGLTHR